MPLYLLWLGKKLMPTYNAALKSSLTDLHRELFTQSLGHMALHLMETCVVCSMNERGSVFPTYDEFSM